MRKKNWYKLKRNDLKTKVFEFCISFIQVYQISLIFIHDYDEILTNCTILWTERDVGLI